MMQMNVLPAAGTVWNLRTYAGNITGSLGAYTFVPAVRPAAVPGLRLQIIYTGSAFNPLATNDSLFQHIHTIDVVLNAFELCKPSAILLK